MDRACFPPFWQYLHHTWSRTWGSDHISGWWGKQKHWWKSLLYWKCESKRIVDFLQHSEAWHVTSPGGTLYFLGREKSHSFMLQMRKLGTLVTHQRTHIHLETGLRNPEVLPSSPVLFWSLIQAGMRRLLPENIHTPTNGFHLALESYNSWGLFVEGLWPSGLRQYMVDLIPHSVGSVDCHPLPSSLLFYIRYPKGKLGKSKSHCSRCPATLDQIGAERNVL